MRSFVFFCLFSFFICYSSCFAVTSEHKDKCSECEFVFGNLIKIAETLSKEKLFALCEKICIDLRIPDVDANVCKGVVPAWGTELLNIVKSKAYVEAQWICHALFRICPEPILRSNWNVTFPKEKPPYKPPSDPVGPTYTIMQISDVHFDWLYSEGTSVYCGEPDCCRKTSGSGNSRAYGEYACDLSPTMFNRVLKYFASEMKTKPDFIVWTGDNPPHFVWNQSRIQNLNSTLTVTKMLYEAFPDTLIIPTLGNHGSFPCNNYGPPPQQDWLYKPLSKVWSIWLPDEAVETFANYGYFSIRPRKGLKVISVQTNYCNNGALWLYVNDTDPGYQLEWLINELQQSEDIGEKVILIGHIPPSTSCLSRWAKRYIEIISRYEMTITASFYGHTHQDSFAMSYVNDRPSQVQYISPSLTTYQFQNPSWRFYTMDQKTHLPVDHFTWQINLEKFYESHANVPIPELFYSAKDAYELPNLLPVSWNNLITRMESNQTLFDLFYYHWHTGYYMGRCIEKCKTDFLCMLSSATKSIFKECIKDHISGI